jgi:hypothetical protein
VTIISEKASAAKSRPWEWSRGENPFPP